MTSEETTTILKHHGAIDGTIISEILDKIDLKCVRFNIPDSKRKKIFNIAVEMFQNLYHYTRDLELKDHHQSHLRHIDLSLSFNDQYYILCTKNFIRNSDIDVLKTRINYINSLEGVALKAYYKKILTNEEFSDKGGAGLGFIDMRKRSGLPLEISFEKIDDNISNYTLVIKIKK